MYETQKPGEGPLYGTKVIDLTQARAGPTCARTLAQMGADVIQVWAPGRADVTGSDYANLHNGKRSIVLDLNASRGRSILIALVRRADVLIENFRPKVKHKLGISPDEMMAINPRLIYGSLSGFGQEGPSANRPGVDPIIQAYSGLMSITGQPECGPSRVGIAISDTAAGMFLTQGVLAALHARDRTGLGQWVHTSLLESMINMLDFQATQWLIDGEVPGLVGNHHPTLFPFGSFRTKDGYVTIGSLDFKKFCNLIGLDDLGADPRYADRASRLAHRQELTAQIEAALMTRPTAEWIAELGEVIPCGPVLAIDEVFRDPQVTHLNVTRKVNHPEMGEVEVLRHPVSFSAMPSEVASGVTLPGADTRALLAELGYDDTNIDQLIAEKVVATSNKAASW
jgi:crotonobetainyl-CoA:carnitine CoA-transferase CaiB-like acyl-CoA transferase